MREAVLRKRLYAVLDRLGMSNDQDRVARYGVNAVLNEVLLTIAEEVKDAVRKTKEEAENYEGL